MIDLTEMAEAIDSALAEGNPCIVATATADGKPDIAFKGSVMVFDKEHLAYWERSGGQSLENVKGNPPVAVLYRSVQRQKAWRIFGEATVYPEGDLREQIMARTNEVELSRDPERKGVGVLVRVDRVVMGRNVIQQRDA